MPIILPVRDSNSLLIPRDEILRVSNGDIISAETYVNKEEIPLDERKPNSVLVITNSRYSRNSYEPRVVYPGYFVDKDLNVIPAVIKTFESTEANSLVSRFKDEMNSQAFLKAYQPSLHIPKVFGFDMAKTEKGNIAIIVQQKIIGERLKDVRFKNIEEVNKCFVDIAKVLDTFHLFGEFCDVSCKNLLRDENGEGWVVDFGGNSLVEYGTEYTRGYAPADLIKERGGKMIREDDIYGFTQNLLDSICDFKNDGEGYEFLKDILENENLRRAHTCETILKKLVELEESYPNT